MECYSAVVLSWVGLRYNLMRTTRVIGSLTPAHEPRGQ